MFWALIIGILVIVLLVSNSNRQTTVFDSVRDNNRRWINFLVGYKTATKNKAEQAIIIRMLTELKEKGMPVNDADLAVMTPVHQASVAPKATLQPAAVTATPAETDLPDAPAAQIDNTSLLLYFGAFLFVAAAGLFVAFGGANGVVRAVVVLLVTTIMYAGGIWMYRSRPQLQQAGQAFAGIGVVLAPLTGVAWYNYVFGSGSGPVVWFATSLLCLGLYVHALTVFKNTLMGYVLIFTFLSLFESGIGVLDAPIYLYGWGIAAVGILVQLSARFSGSRDYLYQSSRMSSQLLLPLSLLVSLALIQREGVMQLGVSLVLAAIYYGLEFTCTTNQERQLNAMVSQVSAILGLAVMTYGATSNWLYTGGAILAAGLLQMLVIVVVGRYSQTWQNFGSIVLVTSGIGILALVTDTSQALHLLYGLIIALIIVVGVWVRQSRIDAYAYSVILFMALPYVYGRLVVDPALDLVTLVIMAGGTLAVVWASLFLRQPRIATWRTETPIVYIVACLSVLFCAMFAGAAVTLAAMVLIVVSLVALSELQKARLWSIVPPLIIGLSVLRTSSEAPIFLATTLIGLTYGITASLRYRSDLLRWFTTGVWLVVPVAFGTANVGGEWTEAIYAYAYLVVMFCLLFSRGIARGVWFMSSNIPVVSYARTASLSYVVGYVTAAVAALCAALASDNSQLHLSLILLTLLVTIWVVARSIEKRTDILALVPVLLQVLLANLVRPEQSGNGVTSFVLMSALIAVVVYVIAAWRARSDKLHDAETSAIMMAYVAPATVVYAYDASWSMPVALLIAGAITLHGARRASQVSRELAVGVVVLSGLWLLSVVGVTNIQAYSHSIAAAFAGLAYWRHVRGERSASDGYIWALLITVTVPLVLQGLDGDAFYGLLLLVEQIAIMLLGMLMARKFVVRWGLYVSLAVVLYQLRNLGYAALAVLALFLIGLAVYRLQKQDDKHQ